MKRAIKKETKTDNRDFRSFLGEEAMRKEVNIRKENPFQLAEESRFYGERVFKIYHDRGVKKESPRVWILNEELFMSKPRESVSSKDESCREEEK